MNNRAYEHSATMLQFATQLQYKTQLSRHALEEFGYAYRKSIRQRWAPPKTCVRVFFEFPDACLDRPQSLCVPKLKLGRSGGEVRQGWRVI